MLQGELDPGLVPLVRFAWERRRDGGVGWLLMASDPQGLTPVSVSTSPRRPA